MSAQNNGYIEGFLTLLNIDAIRNICWVNTVFLLLLADRLNFTPFSSNLNLTLSQSFGMNSLAGKYSVHFGSLATSQSTFERRLGWFWDFLHLIKIWRLGEETQASIPCFFDDFVVSDSDQFFGEVSQVHSPCLNFPFSFWFYALNEYLSLQAVLIVRVLAYL